MAIALNPKRTPNAGKDSQAEAFIAGPDSEVDVLEYNRKPIVIRVPGDLLKQIDRAARKKSLSRSSFIVSTMADLINGEL